MQLAATRREFFRRRAFHRVARGRLPQHGHEAADHQMGTDPSRHQRNHLGGRSDQAESNPLRFSRACEALRRAGWRTAAPGNALSRAYGRYHDDYFLDRLLSAQRRQGDAAGAVENPWLHSGSARGLRAGAGRLVEFAQPRAGSRSSRNPRGRR